LIRKIFVSIMLILTMLMPLFTFAPAIAMQPKLTYTMGAVALPGAIDSGKVFVNPNGIQHTHSQVGISYVYGMPWGNGICEKSVNSNIDLSQIPDEISGSGIEHTVGTYDDGTVLEGLVSFKLTGIGPYIYQGPTFEFEDVTVKAGDVFIGVLSTGTSVKHSINEDSEGIQVRGEWTGVRLVVGPPALVGKGIICETGTYWVTG
jgi:hypothetical protein